MKELLLTSTILIALLCLFRLLLRKKIPARLQYALWLLVALRLLVPVQLGASRVSFVSLAAQVFPETAQTQTVQIKKEPAQPIPTQNVPAASTQAGGYPLQTAVPTAAIADVQGNLATAQRITPTDTSISTTQILAIVWLCGTGAMALWFLFVNLSLRRRLHKGAVLLDVPSCPLRVYETDAAASPCLFGLLRPRIYVTPFCASNDERLRYALTHELTHYRHGDMLWSLLRCILLCVYWFNPLVWLAAILSKRDCELACDEGVLRRLDEQERLAYGKTLVDMVAHCANGRSLLQSATTMYETKKQLKERVKRIVNKPKTLLIAAVCLLLVTVLAVGCAFAGGKTDTPSDKPEATAPPATEPPATAPLNADSPWKKPTVLWSNDTCTIPQLPYTSADAERVNREIREELGADALLAGGECPYQSITYDTLYCENLMSLVIRVNDDGIACEKALVHTFIMSDAEYDPPNRVSEDLLWGMARLYSQPDYNDYRELAARAAGETLLLLLQHAVPEGTDILTEENHAQFLRVTEKSQITNDCYFDAQKNLHVLADLGDIPGSENQIVDINLNTYELSPLYRQFLDFGRTFTVPTAPNGVPYETLSGVMQTNLYCEEDTECNGKTELYDGAGTLLCTIPYGGSQFGLYDSDWLDWANAVSDPAGLFGATVYPQFSVRVYKYDRSWYAEFHDSSNYVYFSDVGLYVPVMSSARMRGTGIIATQFGQTMRNAHCAYLLAAPETVYAGETPQEAAEAYIAAYNERLGQVLALGYWEHYLGVESMVASEVSVEEYNEDEGYVEFSYLMTQKGDNVFVYSDMQEQPDGSYTSRPTERLYRLSDGTWQSESARIWSLD